MLKRTGSATASTVLGIAGLVAVAAAGYAMLTGNTLCGMLGACGEKTPAQAKVVSVTEGDSCCALGGKAQAVVATAASINACPESEKTGATPASLAEGECKGKAESSHETATPVAANEAAAGEVQCPHLRAMQAAAKTVAASSSESCAAKAASCHGKTASSLEAKAALPARRATWTLAAGGFGAPIVLPVFLTETGEIAYDCSVTKCSGAELSADAPCPESKASCTEAAAKVVNASATEAADNPGCCKGKPLAECCKTTGVCEGGKACDKAKGAEAAAEKTAPANASPASGM